MRGKIDRSRHRQDRFPPSPTFRWFNLPCKATKHRRFFHRRATLPQQNHVQSDSLATGSGPASCIHRLASCERLTRTSVLSITLFLKTLYHEGVRATLFSTLVVLVLGQNSISVKPGMTMDAFGRANPGEYTVTQDYRSFPKLTRAAAYRLSKFSGSLFIYDVTNRRAGYKQLHVTDGTVVGKTGLSSEREVVKLLANLASNFQVRGCSRQHRLLHVELPKESTKLQQFTGFLTLSKPGHLFTACYFFKDGIATTSQP
jgi:hypothetical protein